MELLLSQGADVNAKDSWVTLAFSNDSEHGMRWQQYNILFCLALQQVYKKSSTHSLAKRLTLNHM